MKANCHPERKHKANGLCGACYNKLCRSQGSRQNNKTRATCHPDKPHEANGFCRGCYLRQYRKEGKEKSNPRRANCHPDRAYVARGLCKQCVMKEANWKLKGINITLEEYQRRLKEQDGKCAICRELPGKRKLNVDHDHDTLRIRGLLCGYCNWRLLVERNTVEVFERAAEYLRNGGFDRETF